MIQTNKTLTQIIQYITIKTIQQQKKKIIIIQIGKLITKQAQILYIKKISKKIQKINAFLPILNFPINVLIETA